MELFEDDRIQTKTEIDSSILCRADMRKALQNTIEHCEEIIKEGLEELDEDNVFDTKFFLDVTFDEIEKLDGMYSTFKIVVSGQKGAVKHAIKCIEGDIAKFAMCKHIKPQIN